MQGAGGIRRQARCQIVADPGLKAIRQTLDLFQYTSHITGLAQRLGVGGEISEAEILGDRPIENLGLLRDICHRAPEFGGVELTRVDTIQGDRAGLRFVETQCDAQQRGLARAAGTGQRDDFSGPGLKAHTHHGRLVARQIAQAHTMECEVSAEQLSFAGELVGCAFEPERSSSLSWRMLSSICSSREMRLNPD